MANAPTLSVIMPAYNEAVRIGPSVERILSYLAETEKIDYELIVVDDGSTDSTIEVVRAVEDPEGRIRIESLPHNQGKGAAVKAGAAASRGEWVLFTDADLSTDISEVTPFLARAREGGDVVIGSRVHPDAEIVGWNPWYRILSGRVFNRAIRILTLPGVTDTQCGFKLFSGPAAREIFPLARIPGFGFDVELLYIARRRGYTIAEMPIRWDNARNSKISLLRHTLPMLGDVLNVRLNGIRGLYGSKVRS